MICSYCFVFFLFSVLWRWSWGRFYGWLIPGLWIWHCWPGKWSCGFQLRWKASNPADGSTKVRIIFLCLYLSQYLKIHSKSLRIPFWLLNWVTIVIFFFRSGKSSIQKVVFHKVSPNETLFLESTNKIVKDGEFVTFLNTYYLSNLW